MIANLFKDNMPKLRTDDGRGITLAAVAALAVVGAMRQPEGSFVSRRDRYQIWKLLRSPQNEEQGVELAEMLGIDPNIYSQNILRSVRGLAPKEIVAGVYMAQSLGFSSDPVMGNGPGADSTLASFKRVIGGLTPGGADWRFLNQFVPKKVLNHREPATMKTLANMMKGLLRRNEWTVPNLGIKTLPRVTDMDWIIPWTIHQSTLIMRDTRVKRVRRQGTLRTLTQTDLSMLVRDTPLLKGLYEAINEGSITEEEAPLEYTRAHKFTRLWRTARRANAWCLEKESWSMLRGKSISQVQRFLRTHE